MIYEEFEFLMNNDEKSMDFEEESKIFIEQAKKLEQKETVYGIKTKDLLGQISYEMTQCMPWEHVTLNMDTTKFDSINQDRLREFRVFDFVEEITTTNDNIGFGVNNLQRNYVEVITISPNVKLINSAVFACYKRLKKVEFEDNCGLIIIGSYAFAFCENLRTIDIRNCRNLQELPKGFVYESGVTTLKIPSSLKRVNRLAFDKSKLKNIYVDNAKYSFEDFLERLTENDFEAFWFVTET